MIVGTYGGTEQKTIIRRFSARCSDKSLPNGPEGPAMRKYTVRLSISAKSPAMGILLTVFVLFRLILSERLRENMAGK